MPVGYADQFRQQMGPPPAPMGTPMLPGSAPPGLAGGAPPSPEDQVKMLLMQIIQILSGAHNGGPPTGAPGMPGQSPGLPM